MQIDEVILGNTQREGWTFKVNIVTFIHHPEESSEWEAFTWPHLLQAKKNLYAEHNIVSVDE